jgi:hypothetical protein
MTPMKDSIGMKAKAASSKKPFYEYFGGAEWSHRFQKFMAKIRIIDRRNDLYREEVTDPDTGDRLHHCSEPLSMHSGRGSAKKKSSTR